MDKYEKARMEVIDLNGEDVIVTSGSGGSGGRDDTYPDGGNDPDW